MFDRSIVVGAPAPQSVKEIQASSSTIKGISVTQTTISNDLVSDFKRHE